MSTKGGDVKFRFSGDSGPVLNALQDIQNAGAATGQRVALSVGKGSTALGALAKSGDTARSSMARAGGAVGALGGVISKVNPEIGGLVSTVGGASSSLNGFAEAGLAAGATVGAALAAVAAAGVALYAGYQVLTQQTRLAADAEAFHEKHAHDLDAALRGLEDATLKAKVATGELTEAQAAAEASYRGVIRGAEDYAAAHKAEVEEIGQGVIAHQGYLETLGVIAPVLAATTGGLITLSTATDYYTAEVDAGLAKLSELSVAEQDHTSILFQEADATDTARIAAEKKAEADKAASKATEKRREALQLLNDAQAAEGAEAKANATTYASVMAELQAAQTKATTSQLDDIDQINTARMDEVTRLRTAAAAAIAATQEGTDARAELERQLADTIAAVHTEADAKVQSSTDKLVASQKAAAEATAKAWEESAEAKAQASREAGQSILGAEASVFGSLSDLYRADAESKAEHGRKGARQAFEVSRAFAITGALINTALAITNALATVPYPAAPFVAAAAALTGGVQIAAILSEKPSFHAGGMYPDEANAKVLSGEPVINRTAAARLGLDTPGAVNDANHGGVGAAVGGVTVLRIGRLEAREIVRTDIAARGLIVQTAKAAANMAGNPAGRTGRRPIA